MVAEVISQGLWHSKQEVKPTSEQHPALIHLRFHVLYLITLRCEGQSLSPGSPGKLVSSSIYQLNSQLLAESRERLT